MPLLGATRRSQLGRAERQWLRSRQCFRYIHIDIDVLDARLWLAVPSSAMPLAAAKANVRHARQMKTAPGAVGRQFLRALAANLENEYGFLRVCRVAQDDRANFAMISTIDAGDLFAGAYGPPKASIRCAWSFTRRLPIRPTLDRVFCHHIGSDARRRRRAQLQVWNTTSTRRFFCRPSGSSRPSLVWLGEIGLVLP